jgi:hypothetical protein
VETIGVTLRTTVLSKKINIRNKTEEAPNWHSPNPKRLKQVVATYKFKEKLSSPVSAGNLYCADTFCEIEGKCYRPPITVV